MFTQKNIGNRLNEIFEARLGRILEITQQHSKKDSDKRLWARIELFPSGTYENVPFWGGGVDLTEGSNNYPHGMFVLPRENQMILILFIKGNYLDPFAAIPIPHPYDYSFVDKYYEIMENINDIALFHYSGSRIILREDGSIDIQKRIEETTDNFVNHTLKLEFEYDSGNNVKKKTITDVDNDVIVELTTDDVKITDAKDQIFNMHSKTGEEKIELIDKSSQKVLLDSTSGSEKVVIEKTSTQKITMDSNGNKIEFGSQTFEQKSTSTVVNNNLEVLV